ncbi:MAG: aminomethyl-transferring glycine dehydrogenase subunit GcvPA [Caldilineaceae bacterium]|nr:aminomethyl-transferring glycine dehydrogenase subunit GcvPA [Caldilineaceae bacterium]
MSFFVHTDAERAAMLAAIGAESIEALFADVPAQHRFPTLDLPPRLSEMEAANLLQECAEANDDLQHAACFLGAGAYFHYIPSVVDFVISRTEFYSSYTPYQPEIAQGNLQALHEYQTMIAGLSGMEVSNASHYDGATSTAEAVIMARNVARNRRNKVVLAPTLHPHYRETVHTYFQGLPVTFHGEELAAFDYVDALEALVDDETACVVIQNPDFLGTLQTPARLQQLADTIHAHGALLVVAANPISLGLLKPPGDYGADIFVGEGQATGNSLSFGGPYLGLFACKLEHVRKSAGRIVGKTVDVDGNPGYVLTLVAREQFIRRDKASSNICTNQNLNALACAAYLGALGKSGLRQVARTCYDHAHYLANAIDSLPGYEVLNPAPFYHEFVVRSPVPIAELNGFLLDEFNIVSGFDLGEHYPDLGDHCMLVCATETVSVEQMDTFVDALRAASEIDFDNLFAEEEMDGFLADMLSGDDEPWDENGSGTHG